MGILQAWVEAELDRHGSERKGTKIILSLRTKPGRGETISQSRPEGNLKGVVEPEKKHCMQRQGFYLPKLPATESPFWVSGEGGGGARGG